MLFGIILVILIVILIIALLIVIFGFGARILIQARGVKNEEKNQTPSPTVTEPEKKTPSPENIPPDPPKSKPA